MKSVYEERYRVFREGEPGICIYCGEPASDLDHHPPITRVDDYMALGVENEIYVKVRCCRECNVILGRILTPTMEERNRVLKEKLAKRYKKHLLYGEEWTKDEANKLGKNLKKKVLEFIKESERIKRRLAYKEGMQCFENSSVNL